MNIAYRQLDGFFRTNTDQLRYQASIQAKETLVAQSLRATTTKSIRDHSGQEKLYENNITHDQSFCFGGGTFTA